MSYILDALRRAEADREREQGGVPGLHSQPVVAAHTRPPAWRRHAPWLAAAGLLLLAGLGAGLWLAPQPADPASAKAGADKAADAPADTAPGRSPATPLGITAPTPTALPTAPNAASVQTAAPPLTVVLPPTPAASVTPPASTQTGPAPQLERIPLAAELPERVRRDLPKLAISGSVYSEERANRFLIVNGEVVHEGARLAPELLLEQIGPRELVLNFRGQRYRQSL